jgi:hypothetical protein
MKKSEASQIFNISRNMINLWLKRQAQTGDLRAKPNIPPSNGHKITNWNKFRAFAQAHGDKTQAEMAELWEEEISARTISRALQKIGFTRKKRRIALRIYIRTLFESSINTIARRYQIHPSTASSNSSNQTTNARSRSSLENRGEIPNLTSRFCHDFLARPRAMETRVIDENDVPRLQLRHQALC